MENQIDKGILVLIPSKKESKNNISNLSKKTSDNIKLNMQDMAFGLNIRNANNKKNITSKELNSIINSKKFEAYFSGSIIGDIIKEGNKLNKHIQNVENRKNFHPTGIYHFEKTLKLFEEEIYSQSIDSSLMGICSKYNNYVPFNNHEKWYEFYTFIYKTFELIQLSPLISEIGNDKIKENRDFFERYYENSDMEYTIERVLDNYLDKYKRYDVMRTILVKKDVLYEFINNPVIDEAFSNWREDNELYEMIIATDELILPVIWEVKNVYTCLKKYNPYHICEICGSLFRGNETARKCQSKKCETIYKTMNAKKNRAKKKNQGINCM